MSAHFAAGIAALLAILGLAGIWSSVALLWLLWTTDALKSIGMIVPVVSFLLVLRAWRALGWQLDGSWWGLAILLALAIIVRIRDQAVLMLVLSPEWFLYIPPHSVVVCAYGVGAALLFGGWPLVRAARFPLALLLFVNPIPHIFNVYVDLPLQRASAHIARAFAMALGQPLSPDKLRLMFTPEFGMFIAPGCNGIRGAVTMGFIALIAGYLYRFRWRALTLVVLAAVLLGYVFNFVRLCVLVLYYVVALHVPSLQQHAENADYLIGAALFFLGVAALYAVIQRLSGLPPGTGVLRLPDALPEQPLTPAGRRFFWLRAAAMAAIVLFGLAGIARAVLAPPPPAAVQAEQIAMGRFPQRLGSYVLTRTWNENLLTGALLFHWADYAPEAGGTHIAFGISPVLGSHDTLICHTARGEEPLWHGQQQFATAGRPASEPTAFNASFFNDGATQYLEATTLCNGDRCGEYATPQMHLGFVYSRPRPQSLLGLASDRPIPILLRAETIDTTLPAASARAQLARDVAAFLSGADLAQLTQPYR